VKKLTKTKNFRAKKRFYWEILCLHSLSKTSVKTSISKQLVIVSGLSKTETTKNSPGT
jgi:hypothetical protein